QRTEDIECDPFSFADQDKEIIWTKEAYLNQFYAFEIPHGTCNIAGSATPPGPAPPNMACCATGTLDTDGDGLYDCWAVAKGIYFDADCVVDLDLTNYGSGTAFGGNGDPSPTRKDLYIELDYFFNGRPTDATLTTIRNMFAAAPVTNPAGGDGITVHFFVDDTAGENPLTATNFAEPDTDFAPCTADNPSATAKSFDDWIVFKVAATTERT